MPVFWVDARMPLEIANFQKRLKMKSVNKLLYIEMANFCNRMSNV